MQNRLTIPLGISNRHIHISQRDLEALFGPGYRLTMLRPISQKGQFAAEETLDVEGPKGMLKNVRIVGPTRRETQIEISPRDAHVLGVTAPVRGSGDLAGTPGATLIGPMGRVTLAKGLIIPQRHIHMSPADARRFGVYDGARVIVAPAHPDRVNPTNESRRIIFDNVLIRVHESFVLDFHIDTDEANAAGLKNGDPMVIVGFSELNRQVPSRRWITENDVRRAILEKRKIKVDAHTRMTPAARDLGKAHDVFI